VLGFVEKPPRDEAPTNWINAGTYVLEPSVLDRIADGRKVSVERETFPAMVDDGGLWAVKSDAYWVDAGTPATYLQIQLDLLDGRRGTPVDGIAADAVIADGSHVQRSVVMAGASIAAGAHVHDSVIAAGASVGERAMVEGSIVGPDAVVGAGARVSGLSMIGTGAILEAGAMLEGGRVPEED